MLLIDESNRDLYVFVTTPESGGSIYYKSSPIDTIGFPNPADPGTLFIQSSLDPELNNATSTKQNLSDETGLVVLVSDIVYAWTAAGIRRDDARKIYDEADGEDRTFGLAALGDEQKLEWLGEQFQARDGDAEFFWRMADAAGRAGRHDLARRARQAVFGPEFQMHDLRWLVRWCTSR
jgi:hypothetical protein